MNVTGAILHAIDIPFKLGVTHSSASRHRSDSYILEVTDDNGLSGYGEVVARDYVTGRLGGEKDGRTKFEMAADGIGSILNSFSSDELKLSDISKSLSCLELGRPSLPLLCGIETALLDLFCTAEAKDGYELLGMIPKRETVLYGAVIPFMSSEVFGEFLHAGKRVRIPNLKIKVGSDINYNRDALSRTRAVFGDKYDIRVDVNEAWDLETAPEHLSVMRECGIVRIEEPIGRNREVMKKVCALPEAEGMEFIADESFLDARDIHDMAEDGTFKMINLRLAKNGGLFRCLNLANEAEKLGISYHLGSHPGETGILSAMGRFASSLLADPCYVDGSFDSYLLSGNVTDENIDFGPAGVSPIIRRKGMGFRVDPQNLSEFTIQTRKIR